MISELILLSTLSLVWLSLFGGIVILFLNKQNQRTIQELAQTSQSLIDLVSKQSAIIASKDPIAYQAIQTMDQLTTSPESSQTYDPSDTADLERILSRHKEGRVDSDADRFDEDRFEDLAGIPNLGYVQGIS